MASQVRCSHQSFLVSLKTWKSGRCFRILPEFKKPIGKLVVAVNTDTLEANLFVFE